MQYLLEHGRNRPKHVGGLRNGCIIIISRSPIAGMYIVTFLIARDMDNSKYEFCSTKNCQCRILGVLEVPHRAVGFAVWFGRHRSTVINRITTFRPTTDCIYNGSPIRL
jgi:hypothetical protein